LPLGCVSLPRAGSSALPAARDERHAAYDKDAAAKFGTILRWAAGVPERIALTWTKTPTFHAHAAHVPACLGDERLEPRAAKRVSGTGQARLGYDVVRNSANPTDTLMRFLNSADRAVRRCANWNTAHFRRVANGE